MSGYYSLRTSIYIAVLAFRQSRVRDKTRLMHNTFFLRYCSCFEMLPAEPSLFKTFFHFFHILYRQFRSPKSLYRSLSDVSAAQISRYQRYPSLAYRSDLSNKTLVFSLEGALLKSSSFFPYFMLVAFEAGSILRAFLLFLLYPFICLLGEETGMKMMVMVCFFGIKKESFRVGAAVLPKFFLEDVGLEAFEALKRGGKKVAVSKFPQVMIESFLRDYLEIDCMVGRELKVFCGYFVGLMEEKKITNMVALEELLGEEKMINNDVIGISQIDRSLDHKLFSLCKEIYLVRRADKRSWKHLPSHSYPKPLIFHDGRLALRPTPLATLSLFMWIPFGFVLFIARALVASMLPFHVSIPILGCLGFRVLISKPASSGSSPLSNKDDHPKKGLLYVCNHRTLLDPLYLSFALKKNLTAVTYSLSRISEILSPIKTVRLTRDRDQDAVLMERQLSHGDLVVCPEGTTCREPYLLRFSPLFAEMSDVIIPVALNTHVSMFHGTTAGGFKCLDPFFFLMNPLPSYTIHFLEAVSGLSKCHHDQSQKTRYDVANSVQSEIGKALGGFQCTKLTRRDKYLILAGNEGTVTTKSSAT